MVWKDQLEKKKGFYWFVDLAFGEPNNDLIEVKKVDDFWMWRCADSVDWHFFREVDGYKFYGPIEPPGYDFEITPHD